MASRMRRSVTSAVRTCPSTMCRRAVAKSVIAVLDLKKGRQEERLLCGNKLENASLAIDCHVIVGGLWLLYRHGRSEAPFHDWRRGGVATQRTANPCTPVRFRPSPPILSQNAARHFVIHFVVCVHALPRSSLAMADKAILPVRAKYLSRMAPTSRIECPVMAAISA